jgi:hypothetical protein
MGGRFGAEYSTYTPPVTTTIRKPAFIGRIQLVNQGFDNAPEPYNAQSVYEMGMDLKKSVDSRNQMVTILGIGGTVLTIIIIASVGAQ